MEFLANENFPFPSTEILRLKGYKVRSIFEENRGVSDEEVIQKAVEDNLIILTFDSDYGEILFRYKVEKPPSVVFFREKGQVPVHAGEWLISALENDKIIL
jgi:predicted nuclease of predicted toxin-antitoxin system